MGRHIQRQREWSSFDALKFCDFIMAHIVQGGKWVITMKSNPQLLDRCWSWLAMGLIGEQIDEKDEVCGAGASSSTRLKINNYRLTSRNSCLR